MNGLQQETQKNNIYRQKERKRVQDIWDKDPQYQHQLKKFWTVRLNYSTSSNENSIVLDCFCGSGTTLKSAQKNGRKWIGIDQSEHAIKASKAKLETVEGDLFIAKPEYEFLELEKVQLVKECIRNSGFNV